MGIKIIGLGRDAGDTVVTNDDLAALVETSDQWIREKSGIRSRHFAKEKTNGDMAVAAAEEAIEKAGIDREKIGAVLVCTFTPDRFSPSVSVEVAGRLGLPEEVLAVDLNGACTGFLYGLRMAEGLLLQETEEKYILVIGSEKISPLMDMADRATCVLFGDGAGAAVVAYDGFSSGFYGGCVPREEILRCKRDGHIEMSGQEVYRFAVGAVPKCLDAVLRRSRMTAEEVDWFVCHQANERIIDQAARHWKGHTEKFYKNLYHYGNTSAASIPLALCDMLSEDLLKPGMEIVCAGFGAGLTFAGMRIRMGEKP